MMCSHIDSTVLAMKPHREEWFEISICFGFHSFYAIEPIPLSRPKKKKSQSIYLFLLLEKNVASFSLS